MISSSAFALIFRGELGLVCLARLDLVRRGEPRRRIDFSRLNSLRLESPFESFAGGIALGLRGREAGSLPPPPPVPAKHGDRIKSDDFLRK